MRRIGWLTFLVSSVLVLSLVLSGCVTPSKPPTTGNPYFPVSSTRYDKVKITVPLFMSGTQEIPGKITASSILGASVSCIEDAKYEVSDLGGGKKEFKMIFSNAWKGEPSQSGDMNLLDFTIGSDSSIYLFNSELKLVDGPNGNTPGSIDIQMGTGTVVRTSSYVNLNFDGKSYSNVLKVSLDFSDYTFDSITSGFVMDFYFAKNVGLVQFTMEMTYNGEDVTVFDLKVIATNVGTYQIGPSAVTSLSPNNTVVSSGGSVTLSWQDAQQGVSYTVFVYDSTGDVIAQGQTSSKTYLLNLLQSGVYFWIVRTEAANGLSTLSKTAVFTVY